MNITKKQWTIIGVVIVVAILVWYFFLRKKKATSSYAGVYGSFGNESGFTSQSACKKLGCTGYKNGKCSGCRLRGEPTGTGLATGESSFDIALPLIGNDESNLFSSGGGGTETPRYKYKSKSHTGQIKQ